MAEPFMDNILTPGSSLHPTFLLILDAAFAVLLATFVAAAVLTGGNIHIFALMTIELCLWASVKWYVHELKSQEQEQEQGQGKQGEQGEQEEETKKTL